MKAAIDYAEKNGIIFITPELEYYTENDFKKELSMTKLDSRIVHPATIPEIRSYNRPDTRYDFYCWNKTLFSHKYRSSREPMNSVALAAATIVLMKEKNPGISNDQIRHILRKSTYNYEGYPLLDVEKAVNYKDSFRPGFHLPTQQKETRKLFRDNVGRGH